MGWLLMTWRLVPSVTCDRGGMLQEQLHAQVVTHPGRVTHICISKLTITSSDNGLVPGQRQAII